MSPVTEVKISPSTIHICSSAGDTTKGADSGLNGRTCLLVIFHRTLDSLESLSMSLPYWSAINFIRFSSSLFCFLSSASFACGRNINDAMVVVNLDRDGDGER